MLGYLEVMRLEGPLERALLQAGSLQGADTLQVGRDGTAAAAWRRGQLGCMPFRCMRSAPPPYPDTPPIPHCPSTIAPMPTHADAI